MLNPIDNDDGGYKKNTAHESYLQHTSSTQESPTPHDGSPSCICGGFKHLTPERGTFSIQNNLKKRSVQVDGRNCSDGTIHFGHSFHYTSTKSWRDIFSLQCVC